MNTQNPFRLTRHLVADLAACLLFGAAPVTLVA